MRAMERITKKQAIRAAQSKLPILGERKLQEQLECIVGSLAEAYRIGAEEAQNVIANRIAAIGVPRKPTAPSTTAGQEEGGE